MSNKKELYAQLETRIAEISDIGSAGALLSWDQETYMPKGAAVSRGRILQTIAGLHHRMFVDPQIGHLLDKLGNGTAPAGELTPRQNRAVAELRRDYDRSTKVPESLVREIAQARSEALEVWRDARANNDFVSFAPHLKKVFGLARRKAEHLAKGLNSPTLYDALLDGYEPHMTQAQLKPLFAGLRDRTVRLLRELKGSTNKPTTKLLKRSYPFSPQWNLTMQVLRDIGFDFERGRQDKSTHPFTTETDPTDVRLTTRVNPKFFPTAFFSTLHEGGHGLYDQGIPRDALGFILGQATSLGIHESQSRLWENLVGRSRAFWTYYFPIVQAMFPRALAKANADEFYRAVNVVAPSYIRTEADEVTYNLHVILRFELETGMLEGTIDIDTLPKIWNTKMKEYLGVVPPEDARGCLQDIHWAEGLIGYFPTYTLGNIYSVPILRAAEKKLGNLEAMFARGEFIPLRDWLNREVHAVGRAESAEEIARRITGKPLDPGPYMDYLEKKFRDVYQLGASSNGATAAAGNAPSSRGKAKTEAAA